jgi:hypothetical protein
MPGYSKHIEAIGSVMPFYTRYIEMSFLRFSLFRRTDIMRKTPNTTKRITIYLTEDQISFAKQLQARFREEYGAPEMYISRSNWLGLLLGKGMDTLREEL